MKKKKENYFQSETEKIYGEVKGPYNQKSIKKRIEALFLDNLGKILMREQIMEAARDPKTQIVQAANEQDKRIVFSFLVDYFGYQINDQKLERE